MTIPTFYDRVIAESSNTPTNVGTVTVELTTPSPTMTFIGAGTSAGRLFSAVHSNNDVCYVHIYQKADPSKWCTAKCTYVSATDDLTFVAADVLSGSAGVGTLVTWTGVVICEETPVAALQTRSINRGSVIVRNDGSTTQSITSATYTKLTTSLATEETDQNGWWDHPNKKFQPTLAGIYRVSIGVCLGATLTDGATLIAVVYLNGAAYAHVFRGFAAANSATLSACGTVDVSMNGSSDYVEAYVYQSSGSAVSTVAGAERVFFCASRVAEV